MKNVFVVRFEGMRAFSNPRKAVEFLVANFPEWEVTTLVGPKNAHGFHTNCRSDALNSFTVEKLIARLNKEGRLSASEGNDTVDVEKCPVE